MPAELWEINRIGSVRKNEFKINDLYWAITDTMSYLQIEAALSTMTHNKQVSDPLKTIKPIEALRLSGDENNSDRFILFTASAILEAEEKALSAETESDL